MTGLRIPLRVLELHRGLVDILRQLIDCFLSFPFIASFSPFTFVASWYLFSDSLSTTRSYSSISFRSVCTQRLGHPYQCTR